jgi:hypothetical protein
MRIEELYHLGAITDELLPACRAYLTPHVSPLPTLDRSRVNCPDCLRIMDQRPVSSEKPVTLGEYWAAGRVTHLIWGNTSHRCGARGGDGTIMRSEVTCSDCLELIQGVGTPTPLHTPPEMGDAEGNDDGVFTFTDTHIQGCTMEVVPQTSGNVEITVSYGPDDGYMFTLHHLDRADLLRALLHDFHYSPERGGPHVDD